jgi:large subunit ribosomal protein L3
MLGLIGRKVGMTQVFDENGALVPTTVIVFEPNYVVGKRTAAKNGYSAVVLGAGTRKKRRLTKPYAGQFPQGIAPSQELAEIRDFERECNVGDALGPEIFEGLKMVDVRGTTKGKGFQGVIKRWGFHGGKITHGSKFHRDPGSTGNAGLSGLWKGRKMPGRMGNEHRTVQNLALLKIDAEKRMILVKGAVPGTRKSLVVVTAARKGQGQA